ncbi:MAG: hypothetical protein HeimC2_02810 [Candidatus Heimdallarchaeota archaeon LC_2]|nr:MAG: hypothetical protein HeimC2_02810 [Candidatus Heimdallarchaeota archaeon LC_2]
MFPLAIIVATIAMVLGIGGALLFSPIFLLLFPFIGVDTLSPADAFGAALLTEVFGFSSRLYGYNKRKLIDFKTAKYFIVIGVPAAILGTIFKRRVTGDIIIIIFALILFILAGYTIYNKKKGKHFHLDYAGETRKIIDIDGNEYEYIFCNQRAGGFLTSIGAFITGLMSVGIGETTTTTLRLRCNLPMRVASGTSVFVVTVVVFTSALTDIILIGLEAVPWELVMFTIPGVLIGGQIGPKIAVKVDSEITEKLLVIVFLVIGSLMASSVIF